MKRHSLALVLVLLAAPARGESYEVGSTLEPLALADQHGELRKVDASRRALLFTRDMGAGDVLKQALASDGPALLEGAAAVYVADVSAMPAFVFRMFALRKLRQRPYPMLLDRDGGTTARLPAQPGKITFLRLDSLRIAELRYLGTVEEVKKALAAEP